MIVVDAETGVFMMLYLDLAHDQAKAEGRLRSLRDLQDAIMHGAVKRIRPKFMTVATMFIGLVPIMWSMGAGADVMRRIAAAMNVKPDSKCVTECVKAGAKYALYDGKSMYILSDQKEPEKFAGQKVKITGTYNEATKILQVDSMVAAGK